MEFELIFVVVPMLLFARTLNSKEGECPQFCKCHTSDIYCVGDGVSSIPHVPWTMTTLYFRNYTIENKVLWAEHINGTKQTEMLTMENIGIDSIADGAFASLPNLRILDLEGNNLRLLNKEAFRGLQLLKELYLGRNKLTNLNSSFALLENLNFLDLSGNLITKLTDSMFSGINRFLQLVLSSNIISDLGGGGLIINAYFSKIDLSNNPLNGSDIDIGTNNAFYLDLSQVGLRTIPHISASLTGLSLANNLIRKIDNTDILKFSGDYSRFRALVLDNNAIAFIQDDSLTMFESLSVLRLTNNGIAKLFRLPPNLRELHIGGNQIKTILSLAFSDNNSLRFLIMNDNHIDTLFRCSFCGLSELILLDLKNNLIDCLPEGVFLGLSSLYSLNLENNNIQRMISGCFLGIRRLTEINLSLLHNNNIAFQENIFDNLEDLTALKMHNSPYLAHKFLMSPRIFKRLSEITVLDISYNNLSTMDSSISTTFRRLQSLDLSANTWRCDDNLLWLSNWMKSKPHIFLFLDDLNCTSPREMLLTPIISFSDVKPQSTNQPSISSATTREPTPYSTTIVTTSTEPQLIVLNSSTAKVNWHSFTEEPPNIPFNEGKIIGNRERIIFINSTASIGIIFGYSVLGVTVFVFLIIATLLVLNFYRRKRQWFSTMTKFPGFLFKDKRKGISVGYENVITGDQDLLNFDN